MCGIIGYQALNFNKKNVAQALSFVMNRGYDSIGIQINNNIIKKTYPNESDVKTILNSFTNQGFENCIAHTRWATHGNIDELNAHPIKVGNCSVVMNGQIENYEEISKECNNLQTQCDTEIIPYLINEEIKHFEIKKNSEIITNELINIVEKVVSKLKGDFSFSLLYKGSIILFKKGNPLHIGFSANSIVFSSDYRACQILDQTITQSYRMKDNEIILLSGCQEEFCIGLNKKRIENITEIFSLQELNNNSAIHQTQQEILKQGNFLTMNTTKNKDFLKEIKNEIDNLICLGEGSSFHSALHFEELYNKHNISKNSKSRFKKIAFSSSEIEFFNSNTFEDTSLLMYSQSGETKDLINVLKKFKFKKIFIITNNSFSTLAQKSNFVFNTHCGIENGVAATISFTNSLYANSIILNENNFNNSLNDEVFNILKINEKNILKITNTINFKNLKTGFILSENTNMFTLESSLKLSELSEILFMPNNFNALKHGMYSCIEENNTIVILDSSASSSLIHQLLSRKAIVITINSNHNISGIINLTTGKNKTHFEELFLKNVIIQKLAFDIAIVKNLNPDKPKNLAKSVTVES